jgi:alpha-tubulin suppressor-like RCC1 family protein
LATIGAVSYNSVIGRANQTANQTQAVQLAKLMQVQSALTRALPVTGPFTGAVLADLKSIAKPNASGVTVSEGLITVTAAKNGFMSGCTITASTIIGGTNTVACEGISVNAGGDGGGGGNSGDGGGGTQPAALSLSYASTAFTMGSNNQSFAATVTGGDGSETFAYTGTLPTGVAFDADTGAFTGPAANAWNFKATQIAVGGYHACARTTAGTVKCWGYNANGQVGNVTTADSLVPTDVLSGPGEILTGVASVAAGREHTCAVTTSGGVKCWGKNNEGQLGDTTTTGRVYAVAVAAVGGGQGTTLTGVSSVSLGNSFSCALLTTQGKAACWGDNSKAQLGNGQPTHQNSSTPVNVKTTDSVGNAFDLTNMTQIDAGGAHTCAVVKNVNTTNIFCWGARFYGQTGRDTGGTDSSASYAKVVLTWPGNTGNTNANIVKISAGSTHTCAVSDGSAYCWGSNNFGQLGNDTVGTGNTEVVKRVTNATVNLTGVASVHAGNEMTCAVMASNSSVKCWGDNRFSRFGNGETFNTSSGFSTLPVSALGGIGSVQGLTSGEDAHGCALLPAGTIKCWGAAGSGRLGAQGQGNTATPVQVTRSGPQPGFPATVSVTATSAGADATTEIQLTTTS